MFAEFDKVVLCLALELPKSVHADVVAKYGKLKAEVEKFTSTNTASDAIALWVELLTAGKNGISFETWLRANNERVIAACAQRHA